MWQFTNFTTSFRLNGSIIEITISTVHPILLKHFLRNPTHVSWLKQHRSVAENMELMGFFLNNRLDDSHLGRHLEYSKNCSSVTGPHHPKYHYIHPNSQ